MRKDITLTGGTSVTIQTQADIEQLKQELSQFEDLNIRKISDLRTGKQEAVIIETTAPPEQIKSAIESYLGFKLTEENSSIEFTGSVLGSGFYKQLQIAIVIAFVLMAIVVFIIFRTFVPSLAVVLSAFADIVMTLAVVNLLGIKMSNAGVVALLMLIGYSVDSDILLTSRLLRREGNLNSKLLSAFKTGITMTLTSLAAVLVALLIVINFSAVLSKIFTILVIGLSLDLVNTWLTNAGILRWYVENKR